MEYQCGGHLREYDSSTDCLYMFFALGYEPWLELGPGLSQPEALEKAQAWIWSSLSRPKPGHSRGFRAKPGLHITNGVGGADTHDAVIRIQEKIVARETYTTDIGPFERQCVLLCLVALSRTKRIGSTETGRAA